MKLFFCGDIMSGRGIDQVLISPENPGIHEGYVKDARDYVKLAEFKNGDIPRGVLPEYIWGDALEIFNMKKPDLKIINLETAITTSEKYLVEKGINYRMHPDNISFLSMAGIDYCSLSNNHILDWDFSGMRETLSVLDQSHIQHSGAGDSWEEATKPSCFEGLTGRVLVFSVSHISSGVPIEWAASKKCGGVFLINTLGDESLKTIAKVIKRYRLPNDIVILSIHWGSNWGLAVPESQKAFAHALIDEANVDIIHGHSSHHPRAIEIYKDRPIFYGCGDFINDYEGIGGHEEYRSDLHLMYFVDIKTNPFKLDSIDIECLKMKRFQLQLASEDELHWMQSMLNEESDFSNVSSNHHPLQWPAQ